MSHTQPPLPQSPARFIVTVEVKAEGSFKQRLSFIDKERVTFGRSASSDVRFPAGDRVINSVHVELVQTPAGHVLRDVSNRSGLFQLQGGSLVPCREIPVELMNPVEFSLSASGPSCRLWIGRAYPFANYLVTGQLGEGGMAKVFAAQDTAGLNRLVVLKIIASRFLLSSDEGDAEAMLEAESRILAQICHSNVVKVYRASSYEGTPYIEMEYLQGVDLGSIWQQLLQSQMRCPFDLAAALVGQACLGLHAAHEARDASGHPLEIIHRDFSPQNIMCSPEGEVKLIDFGVARALGRRPWSNGSLFVGKAAYASPEQISRPNAMDRRSDLFAAGVILYELIAGAPLFERGSDYWTMNAVMHDPVPPLVDVPDEVNALLARVLSRDPALRPKTAEELAESLERIAQRTGGQFLKPKNIAQTLRQMHISLEAPPPRLLPKCPTVFPRPNRPRLDSRPTPIKTPRPARVIPVSPIPTARTEPQPKSQRTTLPNEIMLADCHLQLGSRLHEHLSPLPDSYSHAIFRAKATGCSNLDKLQPFDVRVHLLGGETLSSSLDPRQRERIESLVKRWSQGAALGTPFLPLEASGEAWPGGPYVLVCRQPAELWTAALSPGAQRHLDLVECCLSLVRCLAATNTWFPGLVHGELGPLQVALIRATAQAQPTPHILLGSWLDWLLSRQPRGLPTLGELPLDRALYMAPECLGGAPPSASSDTFSAAMMIYELMGGNLFAANWALRQGGRLPTLPPSSPAPPALQGALMAALDSDPQRRPLADELLRLSVTQSPSPSNAFLELVAPAPGEEILSTDGEGRRVHLHSLLLSRWPAPLPFLHVPELLSTGIGLIRFREKLAIELLQPNGQSARRQRLYSENSHEGTERLFLTGPSGAFALGSRSQGPLQRIEYHVAGPQAVTALEIHPHKLRVISSQASCVALLWTREQRSGDLHVCCAQVSD